MSAAKDWPLLLAGPIVRRVEPGYVSVWVALKEPRAVRLSIFEAPVDTGPGGTIFAEPASLMNGITRTVRVGANLHVAVADASSPDPLLPGHIYAYNVSFGPHGSEGFAATEDLRSLLLLRDHRPVEPPATEPPPADPQPFVLPYLALGYEPNLLPTFVLPPDDLAGLRVVHGSCRRPAARVPDLLTSLDEQIEAARTDAAARPHQLFMTGDQIYADDVAPALLHLCTAVGNELMGTVEQLPISWAPPGQEGQLTPFPCDHTHFPAGARKGVVREDGRMTTVDGESHLLSLGEFCAMHLLAWNNALWPKKLPTFDELFWQAPLPNSKFDTVHAGIDFPPGPWQLHTGLYDGATVGLKNVCEDTKKLRLFTPENVGKVLKCISANESLKEKFGKETEKQPGDIKAFRDGIPKVRRALANVPSYMMFDDHEVTDDWNLSAIWRDRVLTSPLGRTVLRNGLLAYLVCQGWGNDPKSFYEDIPGSDGTTLDPSPRKRLLHLCVPKIFPAAGDAPADNTAALNEVDQLLGLDGGDPPVHWHYQVDGPRHRVLVLDSRTRRAFRSRTSPPINLSPSALRDQIPDLTASPLPAGIEVLFVVSPLPLFGVPLFEEFAGQLAVRAYDATHHTAIAGMPGTNPDAGEGWANIPEALEEVLAKLAPYRRIVVLSGDVHYGHSSEVSYWLREDAAPARFAQFTASGMKNVWPDSVVILNRSFGLFENVIDLFNPVQRHGWFSHEPPALRLPEGTRPMPGIRLALLTTPLLLPAIPWPEGTVVERQPDWAWRLQLVADKRPHNKLPGGAKPAALDPANPEADAPASVEGYRLAARRHAQQLEKTSHTRRLLFASNFGVITFSRDDENRLTARQELFARPGGSGSAAAFTVHDIALDAPPEPMPLVEIEQPQP
jgi:hypothetical protein